MEIPKQELWESRLADWENSGMDIVPGAGRKIWTKGSFITGNGSNPLNNLFVIIISNMEFFV